MKKLTQKKSSGTLKDMKGIMNPIELQMYLAYVESLVELKKEIIKNRKNGKSIKK